MGAGRQEWITGVPMTSKDVSARRRSWRAGSICYEIQRSDEIEDAGFAPLRDVVMDVKQAWDGVCACHDEWESDDVADACGEDEDRFDAAIAHLVAVLDGNPPDASQDATWGTDGHR